MTQILKEIFFDLRNQRYLRLDALARRNF